MVLEAGRSKSKGPPICALSNGVCHWYNSGQRMEGEAGGQEGSRGQAGEGGWWQRATQVANPSISLGSHEFLCEGSALVN